MRGDLTARIMSFACHMDNQGLVHTQLEVNTGKCPNSLNSIFVSLS